jgi:hypothetical protein
MKDANVEGKYDYGCIDSICHPPDDSVPVKEQVLGALLVQCWELEREKVILEEGF